MRKFLLLVPLALVALTGCRTDPADVFAHRDETLVAELADGTEWTSRARGIRPLFDILSHDRARFAGAVAYDRIVGRAAAFLYVKLGVREVAAPVMSVGAARILRRHGIRARATQTVPAIRNRKGTGPCPMDTAVRELGDDQVDEAVAALRAACSR